MKYILSKKAIAKINTIPGLKAKMSLILNLSENSINRLIRDNHQSINGNLTKSAVVELLMVEANLDKTDILHDVSIPNAKKVQAF